MSKEKYYTDPTHVPEIDKEITEGKKDAISIKLAKWLREKMYGVDVRESMARFVEWTSVKYHKALSKIDQIFNRQVELEKNHSKLEDKLDNLIASDTNDLEVNDARSSEFYQETFKILGKRLDKIESTEYVVPSGKVNIRRTLIDDLFSANHEISKMGEVAEDLADYPIVIANVDSVAQNRFKFVKVGDI